MAGTDLRVDGLKELRRALRGAAEYADSPVAQTDIALVRQQVQAYAPSGPSPRRSSSRPLRSSFRMSVTRKRVSLYSNEPHAEVQDQGGQVGRNRATVLPRSKVSRYAERAIRDTMAVRARRVDEVLDDLADRFGKGL